MGYMKLFGLTAAVVAALMAVAGSAVATTITSPTGTVATPTLHLENSGGHVNVANPIGTIFCNVTLEAAMQSHGTGVTATGSISTIKFTGCTNGWHVTASTPGSLEMHWTSGYNGELSWDFAKFSATRLGVTCVYETGITHLGSLTGGSPATVAIGASIPINTTESSGLCGSSNAKAEGSLVSTSAYYLDK